MTNSNFKTTDTYKMSDTNSQNKEQANKLANKEGNDVRRSQPDQQTQKNQQPSNAGKKIA